MIATALAVVGHDRSGKHLQSMSNSQPDQFSSTRVTSAAFALWPAEPLRRQQQLEYLQRPTKLPMPAIRARVNPNRACRAAACERRHFAWSLHPKTVAVGNSLENYVARFGPERTAIPCPETVPRKISVMRRPLQYSPFVQLQHDRLLVHNAPNTTTMSLKATKEGADKDEE